MMVEHSGFSTGRLNMGGEGFFSPDTPHVVVLLSTYNGERFVAEQLESILHQLPETGHILVRDDGSHDRTVEVISGLNDCRISLFTGTNQGFGQSFLSLLALAPADADMVMFSDQDDVWLPGKIERAWRHLSEMGPQPALYGSAQMLVDINLRALQSTPPWPRKPSLSSALTENIITGCTAAINRSALLLLQRAGVPSGVHFHDWWLYLVVSAFGKVVYDDEPTLLYRQHGRNVIGHGAGWWRRQLGVIRFLLRNDWVGILLGQVHALLKHYRNDLPTETRQWILEYFAETEDRMFPRWRLIFSTRRWRQAFVWEFALRALLTAHKLRLWPPPSRRL